MRALPTWVDGSQARRIRANKAHARSMEGVGDISSAVGVEEEDEARRSVQEDGRSVWAAAGGVVTAAAGNHGRAAAYGYRGGKVVWNNRRSLGARIVRPPAPVSNRMKAAAMPGPPSPTTRV
uniref:Uncharacterized protein n=1 Tax=Zea mays TaxID=4577 RepID=A0A804QZL2_MAIZE